MLTRPHWRRSNSRTVPGNPHVSLTGACWTSKRTAVADKKVRPLKPHSAGVLWDRRLCCAQEHAERIPTALVPPRISLTLSKKPYNPRWLWTVCRSMLNAYLQRCVLPRVTYSPADAAYCAAFTRRLHEMALPFFPTILYFDTARAQTPCAAPR